ncbi:MAG: SDR family oxidoreductase [Lacipirellulaceae bacterium]
MPEQTTDVGVIVILGATGSVGTALASHLAAQGTKLLLGGRDRDAIDRLGEQFDCRTSNVEASDGESITAAIELAKKEHGRVDGVVNCIGSVLLKPAHTTSDEEWNDVLTTNLFSSFAAVRAAAKAMRSEGGSIALVSSAAAQIGLPNHEAIAAAKAGIAGLVRSAAATYGNRGIRVNAVSPGLVKSEMTRKLWESEATAKHSEGMHALGRLGEPEDIASALAWLVDPKNSWVTGQVLGVDGGLGSLIPR